MTSPFGPVDVLDVARPSGRRLMESSLAAGFEAQAVTSPDELKEALTRGAAEVALVAFDAIRPQPQAILADLRRSAANATIVGVVDPDSPRARLAERLWNAGAMSALVQRSVPPSELGAAVRNALQTRATPFAAVKGDDIEQQLAHLAELGAAFAPERTVTGVLRALRLRLGRIQPFQLLQIFVPLGASYRVISVSRGAVAHSQVYSLLQACCAELTSSLHRPVRPEDIDVGEPEQSPGEPFDSKTQFQTVVLQMPGIDGPAGCMGVVVPSATMNARQLLLLKQVAHIVSSALRHAQQVENAERHRLEDALTGCKNRRFLTETLETEWKRANRYGLQLSVGMLDVDHFKRLNDVFGHVAGDEVLKNFAAFLRRHFRETDSVVRYGGEEFAILMPETGPAEAAMKLERVRILASAEVMHRSKDGTPVQISFSAGVAAHPASPVESPDALLREADAALYTAKRSGRDRVCIAALPEGEPVDVTLTAPSQEVREMRGFPRVPVRMPVRLIELTDFETRMSHVMAADISAGGIAIAGAGLTLKKDAWALIYVEDAQKPMLTRVVWSSPGDGSEQRVGLRFVTLSELSRVAQNRERERTTTRTLVCVERLSTENMVLRVLHAAQHDITRLFTNDPVPEDIHTYSLLVLGEGVLRQRPDIVQAMGNSTRVVVVNEGSDRERALETLVKHEVQHMVSLDQGTDEALFATLNKLLIGEYFGVRKYLLWGAKLKQWRLHETHTKNEVLQSLAHFAAEMNCHPRVIDMLVMAVDEMIINAMFRAPEGQKPKPVFVECGSDGRLLAVSVLDEFGKFKAQDLYQGLAKARGHQAGGIPEEATHASLGFKIMLDALSHLAVNVDQGARTEVIGIVDLRKSLKELRSGVPGVDLFHTPKKDAAK